MQPLAQGLAAALAKGQGLGDRRRKQRRVGDRLQRDEDGAVGETALCCGGRGNSQPCLADPARPAESEQAHLGAAEQGRHLGDFALATDQRGQLGRQRGQGVNDRLRHARRGDGPGGEQRPILGIALGCGKGRERRVAPGAQQLVDVVGAETQRRRCETPGQAAAQRAIAGVVNRDEAALAELYEQFGALVFAIALRITGDHAVAEEVLQDVFLAVWRTAHGFRQDGSTPRLSAGSSPSRCAPPSPACPPHSARLWSWPITAV